MKKNRLFILPLIALLLVGCAKGENNKPSDDPVTPVEPEVTSNNKILNQVFYSAHKYNSELTLAGLIKALGFEEKTSTTYNEFFAMIYHGFKDSLPEIKGARRYMADFDDHSYT
nr:hypothetical protein [Bacilli bacterium]